MADEMANEAARENQDGVGWLYDVAKARIKAGGRAKKREILHERSRETYGAGNIDEMEEKGLTREEQVRLTRFRIGHSLDLAQYEARIGRRESGRCRLCGESDETATHLVKECMATYSARERHGIENMEDLCSKPRSSSRFLDEIKRLTRRAERTEE